MIKFNPQKDLLRVLHFIDKFSADSKRVERLRPFFNFRSQIYFKYDGVLNRPDLSNVLGRKWKSSLPKLIMLGRYCKNHLCNFEMDYRTYDYTDYPPIEINQNDPHLQSQVGSVNLTRHEKESQFNLSRLIKKSMEIGLLYCPPFGNHFSFNNLLKSDNFAKIYFFNPDLLDYLEETASENKIKVKPYKKRTVKKSSSKSARQVHLPSSSSPSISSSIISSQNIYSDISISMHIQNKKDAQPQSHQVNRSRKLVQNTTEESALSAHGIIGKIGTETLTFTQKVANRMRSLTPKECEQMINEYNPELRHYQKVSAADGMKFDINQHRSKAGNLTKVSIRETSGFCLKKKEEREMELLESWSKFDYYDVNGSIYRCTYAINTGIWMKSDKDIYQLISPQQFKNDRDRAVFKRVLMSVYFSPSAKQSVSWIKRRIYNGVKQGKLTKAEADKMGKIVDKAITYLYTRLREVIGKTHGNQVFYYESCIYMHLRRFLMERGYEVRQCYDAFYVDKELPQNMDEILQHCAEEYVSIRRKMGGVIPYDDESNRPLPEGEVTNDEEMNALLMQMFDFDQFRAMIDGKFTQDVDELYEHKIE